MKYAVTGHTKGIGKCLFNRLSPDIIGFSRSNGYDLFKFEDRQRIIQEVADCDVFINSAPAGYAQTRILIELFKIWHNDPNKTIINVGSNITDVILNQRHDLLFYQSEKILLKETCKKLVGKCKITYKTFGYVGTEAILAKYPHFAESDYISENAAVDIILS